MISGRGRNLLIVLLFPPVCLLAGAARASTLLPATLEELSVRAEVVVLATVAEQEARFDRDRTAILTHTTLSVEETIAGYPVTFLEVSEYGGRVGDRVLAAPGMPRFREGQSVLLFACRDPIGLLRTCGATQGKMAVRIEPSGARRASGVMAGQPVDGDLGELRRRIRAARGEGSQ